jgi:lysozyme
MNISNDGITLIEGFESLKLTAYQDSKGVWTIGYGHTGPDVYEGLTITEDQADALQQEDLNTAETCVNNDVTVDLQQCQFDALVSFTFNVGSGNEEHSTLLSLLNSGDYADAANQFTRWDQSGGQVVPGLLRRRKAEQAMFLGNDWQSIMNGTD